jgi:hypothetical protein
MTHSEKDLLTALTVFFGAIAMLKLLRWIP